MTAQEKKKAHIMTCVVKQTLTVKEAATRLGLSQRQVKRLKKQALINGVASFLHKNCGRQPKHSLSAETKERILAIKSQSAYDSVNFLHFQELLLREHQISISYSALRNLLVSQGYTSPKKHRKRKVKHPRRERKAHEGQMLQVDASNHAWFKGNPERYTIHGFIDDATGILTGLYMTKNECLEGYLQVVRQTIKNHGVPESLYLDGLSIFFSSKKLTIEEELEGKQVNQTQFGTMMQTLGIQMIHARSSQAKGRIEREWGTLQGRLETEFALRNITTVEDANAFFPVLIRLLNQRFAVAPTEKKSKFIPLQKGLNLDRLLAYRLERTIDAGGCFSLNGTTFTCGIKGVLPKTKLTLLISSNLGLKVLYNDKLYTPTPLLTNKKEHISGSSVMRTVDDIVFSYCLKDERAA